MNFSKKSMVAQSHQPTANMGNNFSKLTEGLSIFEDITRTHKFEGEFDFKTYKDRFVFFCQPDTICWQICYQNAMKIALKHIV